MLGDARSVDELVRDLARMGYITSFCTAGYRIGRTGERIMRLLRSCHEGDFCKLNAILTFREWLDDFASPATKAMGEELIQRELAAARFRTPKTPPEVFPTTMSGRSTERATCICDGNAPRNPPEKGPQTADASVVAWLRGIAPGGDAALFAAARATLERRIDRRVSNARSPRVFRICVRASADIAAYGIPSRFARFTLSEKRDCGGRHRVPRRRVRLHDTAVRRAPRLGIRRVLWSAACDGSRARRKTSELPNGLGITLCVGEQTADTYARWLDAGAHRYLLRVETSGRGSVFARLHPRHQPFDRRVRALSTLKALGYQFGNGGHDRTAGPDGGTAGPRHPVFQRHRRGHDRNGAVSRGARVSGRPSSRPQRVGATPPESENDCGNAHHPWRREYCLDYGSAGDFANRPRGGVGGGGETFSCRS